MTTEEPSKGLILRMSGEVEPVVTRTYEDIQDVVGGAFDICTSSDNWVMYCNDVGRLDKLPNNELARKFVAWACNCHIDQITSLHGDFLLLGSDNMGEDKDLPADIAQEAEGMALYQEPNPTFYAVDHQGDITIDKP